MEVTFTYIVLPDRERLEWSWESNAEKVTSDVHSRNTSHGFYFQHFQAFHVERDKHINDLANEL